MVKALQRVKQDTKISDTCTLLDGQAIQTQWDCLKLSLDPF